MVPVPSCPATWDYWSSSPSDVDVELTCLMPNYIFIPLRTHWNATLHEIKEELWEKASLLPLFGMLQEMSRYVFRFVNSLAVREDVDDESKILRDIRPVCGVLILNLRDVSRPGEQFLNIQISHLIGKGLTEFENLRSPEVNDFRARMKILAEESLINKIQSSKHAKLRYQYPPRISEENTVSPTLMTHLNNQCFILVTKIPDTELSCAAKRGARDIGEAGMRGRCTSELSEVDEWFSFTLNVHFTLMTKQHIENILKKLINQNMRVESPDSYVLKVCGREEYLLGEAKLIQYLYIQDTLLRDGVPQVMLVNLEKLMQTRDITYYTLPERKQSDSTTMRKRNYDSSWNIKQKYSCLVQSVGGLNVEKERSVEVVCQAGIFHGGKPLCEPQKTKVASVSSEGVAQWDEELQFPITVCNLPRSARLCFAIYEITKIKQKRRGKDKDYINKLAWANTMIFDYKELLRMEGVTLYMWAHAADETSGDDLLLQPLGTVVSNPNTDSCAALQVRFSSYDSKYNTIMFPSQEEVKRHSEGSGEPMPSLTEESRAKDLERFKMLRAAAEVHEQERKDLWAAREFFRTTSPELLPKLLSYVDWSERGEAADVAKALSHWPLLKVECALELLDYAYADAAVRSFAVQCLATISDEELLLYLLQLVQALKHESYLMCDLSKFLLQRAFSNMTIGHYLFWHLRSEMHGPSMPSVSVRFGLMLEAYCRGCQNHIGSLMRQINCLDKLKWVSQCVSKKKEISKARAALQHHLAEQHCLDALKDFVSPLEPGLVCKRIKIEHCRVMDSKKRPLMLDFDNADPTGSNIRIILKIGDDLRQDMFTLQMLRIMDQLWKNAGYDFRLNPYNCISMEHGVGMIEVVDDAETVANIQKQSALFNAASPISKTNLFQWLKKHNVTEMHLNKAIEEFTMSCAGYCVATYVLGIADRHPDNIMVKKRGQLFHIDFGHFLGKFKHKYGFKRERVPFVLTHDFIHVINRGQRSASANMPLDFKVFKDNCESAFKILRKHGDLILSLFSMMISTGLQELSSEKDLQYLKDTLVMDLTEEQAMDHFRMKFIEAMKNSWTTTFNWALHNIDRNN